MNLIKLSLVIVYIFAALCLLFLHLYFIYNVLPFPLTRYYWWLIVPVLFWLIKRLNLDFKTLFSLGFICFILGAALRVFSSFGEFLINLTFIVIIASFTKYHD